MNSPNKRGASIIALLVGLAGIANLVIGVLSFSAIYSMNIPGRTSALRWVIDSIDPNLVTAGPLQTQVTNLKTTATGMLNVFLNYTGYLNAIPAYLILQGIIFLAVSIAIYLYFPKKRSV